MKELLEKYKYYIGGSTIGIILIYLIYNNLFNNIDNKEIKEIKEIKELRKEKNEIIKSEISHEEFLKTLTEELLKLRKSMVILNENYLKSHNNSENFEKQFKKDILKKNIIIDTIHMDDHSSNYIINLGDDNLPEVYKNVIGFRLINAVIPYTFYTVNDNNNIIKIRSLSDSEFREIKLAAGHYTFTELGGHLQEKIVDEGGAYSSFKVTSSGDDFKYTISDIGGTFEIDWINSTSNRLFGFFKKVNSTGADTYTSDNEADHSVHYIDLVITEIPSIACKINNKGKEIISRIPFNADAGSLIYYRTPEHELQTSNYFYPIKLSQLTIQLIDDHGNIYDCNNADNSFEFELTILQNTALLK